MEYLLRLYALLPAWLVAVGLLAASGSWVINYHWQRRYERLPLYPPMSLGLAGVVAMLAAYYIGLALAPDMPGDARAGGVRVLLLVWSLAQVAYNGGMIWRSIREFVKAWSHRD